MSENDKNKSTEQYLKKLQTQTPEQKKEQALKILHRQQNTTSNWLSWLQPYRQKIEQNYQSRKKEFLRQIRYSENKHLFVVTIFFVGAVWISWKIQDKYDKMKQRAHNTKSFKKRQIQNQNEYIQKMLSKNPFEPVTIEQEEKENEDYIYKKAEIQFDTRADLLEILERQKGLMRDQDIEKL